MSPAAQSLFAHHERLMQSLDRISKQCPWEDPRFYALWCAQTYHYVAHSTRTLSAAAARFNVDRDAQHIRFIDHCQEEKHHEKMLRADMKAIGFNLSDFPEMPMTAQLYQAQYYLIEHRDPIALFGNIFYMEGFSLSSGPEIYARCQKAHGEKACTFLRVHVGEDVEHLEKAKQMLLTLPDDQLRLIEWSLAQTAVCYEALLVQQKEEYLKITSQKAA